MRKILLFVILTLLFIPPAFSEKRVQVPERIRYEGMPLKHNPSWKDEEVYIEANLDQDPDEEIILGFVAGYKEEKEPTEEKEIYEARKKELALIKNYTLYQIYDKRPNGYYEVVKTISGMDRMGRVDLAQLNEDEPPAIFILSPGGQRYLDLSVYQWRNGGYVLIFNKGSSGKIEYDTEQNPISIRIENREGQQDTFVWSPQKKVWQLR